MQPVGPEADEAHAKPQAWWKVMCLTGVDYFSTLAYLPAIAALAAGALSPLATLLIVALTLLGMLPMYRRVAKESPHGQGSVAMLEDLLPFWRGKLFVLVLLGFVATSWIITITLSAADATVHLIENPLTARTSCTARPWPSRSCCCSSSAGCSCSASARRSASPSRWSPCSSASTRSSWSVGLVDVFGTPGALSGWTDALTADGGGFGDIVVPAVLAFPLLVLGLSGFETGVSMMPLVAADGDDPAAAARAPGSATPASCSPRPR